MKNKPIILDGKKVAEELLAKLPNQKCRELAIITIGDNPASKVYVRNKIKTCEKVGIKGVNYKFNPDDYKSPILLSFAIENKISNLNEDNNVIGIMIQQPYSEELKDFRLEDNIDFITDVDGLTMTNMYKTLSGKSTMHYPATPKGIITLLDYYKIPIEGKNVVIIGRSDIVGKPLAAMMLARNATVTICHSKTLNLKQYTLNADIIISAIGKPKFINKYFLSSYYLENSNSGCSVAKKPIIIDVGINRDENGKLCGDVDFDNVLPYVSAITPVPGGIGPMTVYSLIENCCQLYF